RLESSHGRERRPPIFRVVTESRPDGSDDEDAADVTRLAVNPDFNVELSFAPDTDPADMPAASYRGGGDRRGRVIVGPAWVNGRFRAAVERGETLPWAGFLASALRDEWRLDPRQARKRYG